MLGWDNGGFSLDAFVRIAARVGRDSHAREEGVWLPGTLPLGDAACTPVRVLATHLSELRRRQARIIAFITEAALVERILTHLGEPAQPLRKRPFLHAAAMVESRPIHPSCGWISYPYPFLSGGHAAWSLALPMAAGQLLGAWLRSHLVLRHGTRRSDWCWSPHPWLYR